MTTSLVGLKVPEFSAPSSNGETFNLHDFTGNPLVLFFYPKDNTPGCTAESIQFTKLHKHFLKYRCEIIGISKDSIESHKKFIKKYKLSFDLISDESGEVCQMFGVMKMKNMYGRKYLGIERSTFLINEKGIVSSEWRKVKVPDHAEQVLQMVASL